MQLISLITDYGTTDHYVGEFKAALYSRCKDFAILDINHTIPIHDISLAAYQLRNVSKSAPEGSIFIVAVNNHYASKCRYICFEKEGKFFIGPDNGVFSLVFEDLETTAIFGINTEGTNNLEVHALYAHAAACINHGLPLSEIGVPVTDVLNMIQLMPVVTRTHIRSTIIHIDHYENVITNLTKDLFERTRGDRSFALFYKPHNPLDIISKNYSEVPVGEVLCHFNNAGFLEIAINMGRASSMLNLNRNETIQIDFF